MRILPWIAPLLASPSLAAEVEALVVFTDKGEAALPGGETMAGYATEHDLGFDAKTADDPDTAFFEIKVIDAVEADAAYQEGTSLDDVLAKAEDGTIKVGGRTISEKRHETGADIVIIVSTATIGAGVSARAISKTTPVNNSNYITITNGARVDAQPDGSVWLHEVLHMLGADEDRTPACFQNNNSNDLCQEEIDAIENNGGDMAQYGEEFAQSNLPHQAQIAKNCMGGSNWEVTIANNPGIFDVVIERKYGTGPWGVIWSGDGAVCLIRSGTFYYRTVFVDVFGNQGAYSSTILTTGTCGQAP